MFLIGKYQQEVTEKRMELIDKMHQRSGLAKTLT